VVPCGKIYYFATDSWISLEKRVADWLLALISSLVQKDIPCDAVTHVGRVYFVENFLHRTMKNSPGSVAVPFYSRVAGELTGYLYQRSRESPVTKWVFHT
jgi:hypothetical protein